MSKPIKRLGEILPEVLGNIQQRMESNKKTEHREKVLSAVSDYIKGKRCA